MAMTAKRSATADAHERAEMKLLKKFESLHPGASKAMAHAPAAGHHHHLHRAHHHLSQAHKHLSHHAKAGMVHGESKAEHAKAGRAAHHRGRKKAAAHKK